MTDGLVWLEADEFHDWVVRMRAERAGRNLTAARRDALTSLSGLIAGGDDSPTDAEVAALAHCSARTVRRARGDARALGLLQWDRTRALVCDRWRQGRNRYRLRMPSGPVCPAGQRVRARKEEKVKRAQEAPRSAAAQMAPHGVGSADECRAYLQAMNAKRLAQIFPRTG